MKVNQTSFPQQMVKEVEREGGCEGRRGRRLELEHPIQPLPSDLRLQEFSEAMQVMDLSTYSVNSGHSLALRVSEKLAPKSIRDDMI